MCILSVCVCTHKCMLGHQSDACAYMETHAQKQQMLIEFVHPSIFVSLSGAKQRHMHESENFFLFFFFFSCICDYDQNPTLLMLRYRNWAGELHLPLLLLCISCLFCCCLLLFSLIFFVFRTLSHCDWYGGGVLTAVGVGLAEVRRGGRLNWQLRHRHLTRHRVSCAQTAYAAAIFSVRAHLWNREQDESQVVIQTNRCF